MARVIDRRAPDVRAPRLAPPGRTTALGLGLLAALSTAWAGDDPRPASETPPGVTLRHLVEVARRNKAAELAAATARLAGTAHWSADPIVAAPARAQREKPDGGPRLWSLVAAGDRWRAEVLWSGRLHVVDGPTGPQTRIGPWRVLGLATEGLRVEQVATGGHAHPPLRQLVLPPPARGVAAASHRFVSAGSPAADGGENSDDAVQRAAALPLSMSPAVPDTAAPNTAAHAPAAAPSRASAP
ncbi:hypothetical protein [Mitsuaria sp. 7]|uniref:hypothetical protein n=1 Tax=Mitsuaria sp. 7 TaxID=1658665 RepID=UPI0007DDBFA5|nr:hypothetical protein [Mitsuaria sp. 7]ANH67203.1 hypothetical protein ABE85_05790 [Mitsuaria sp. 7]